MNIELIMKIVIINKMKKTTYKNQFIILERIGHLPEISPKYGDFWPFFSIFAQFLEKNSKFIRSQHIKLILNLIIGYKSFINDGWNLVYVVLNDVNNNKRCYVP